MSKKLTLVDKLSGNIDYASGKLKDMIDSYGCTVKCDGDEFVIIDRPEDFAEIYDPDGQHLVVDNDVYPAVGFKYDDSGDRKNVTLPQNNNYAVYFRAVRLGDYVSDGDSVSVYILRFNCKHGDMIFEERRALENGYDWENADDYEISNKLVSVDYD